MNGQAINAGNLGVRQGELKCGASLLQRVEFVGLATMAMSVTTLTGKLRQEVGRTCT